MVERIITGIQSSGKLHLGNILGAIKFALDLIDTTKYDKALFFIADLHSLTTIKNSETRIQNINYVTATWLACGLDVDKSILFRQSRVPQVCELAWYLNCFTPYPMLANAHSFKDKTKNLADVNAGLFMYPVLMAADILLYGATLVPVGKDQLQHLEITRDIVKSINAKYGEIFLLPKAIVNKNLEILPGTDGRKMSKSYGNTIDVFLPEKDLYRVVMSIHTDSTPLEMPKKFENCNVYNIYKSFASEEQILEMQKKYQSKNYGYGMAKKELFEVIMQKFETPRILFNKYINEHGYLEGILKDGEVQASTIAEENIKKFRTVFGY